MAAIGVFGAGDGFYCSKRSTKGRESVPRQHPTRSLMPLIKPAVPIHTHAHIFPTPQRFSTFQKTASPLIHVLVTLHMEAGLCLLVIGNLECEWARGSSRQEKSP